jgi:hypothetical protein
LQYFEHRHIDGDYNTLIDLLISDRLHVNLPEHVIKYLTTMEMTTKDGWLRSTPLAETLDNYFSVHRYDGKPLSVTSITSPFDMTSKYDQHGRRTSYFNAEGGDDSNSAKSHNDHSLQQVNDNQKTVQNKYQSLNNRPTSNDKQTTLAPSRLCFICSSNSHLRKDCPHRDKQNNNRGPQDNTRLPSSNRKNGNDGAREFTCSAFSKSNDVIQSVLRPDDHC